MINLNLKQNNSSLRFFEYDYILEEKNFKTKVPLFTFDSLNTRISKNLFSTKIGGFSKNQYSTLNFAFSTGDNRDDVMKNYQIIAKYFNRDISDFIIGNQKHTNNILKVTNEDRGKGTTKEKTYGDIDGFITNVPNIILTCVFADCVPLYILDPINKAIGLSHSGWKGTYNNIAKSTMDMMKQEYGSNPKDLIVAIGPSICVDCYEVSEDLAIEFSKKYENDVVIKKGSKYYLDLWTANKINFLNEGILEKNINTTNICTYCNPDLFFSHRRLGFNRGNLAAFFMLTD